MAVAPQTRITTISSYAHMHVRRISRTVQRGKYAVEAAPSLMTDHTTTRARARARGRAGLGVRDLSLGHSLDTLRAEDAAVCIVVRPVEQVKGS